MSGNFVAFTYNEFSSWRWLLALVLVAVLGACGESGPDPDAEISAVESYRLDPIELARGEAIYRGSCANFCHEVEDDDAANLFDCEWVHGSSDDELHRIIIEGIPGTRMVGFGTNLPEGDDDVWRIIAYLRQQQPQCGADEFSNSQ